MKSHELPHIEEKEKNDLDPIFKKLIDGPPSNNYNHRQIQLIVEMMINDNPDEEITKANIDKAGMQWANSAYSKAFSFIAHNEIFKDHPRFKGEISSITLLDVENAIKTNKMPEN